jgi:hypothetical protein
MYGHQQQHQHQQQFSSQQEHQQFKSVRKQSPRLKVFSVNQSNRHVPSKVFQYVDRKFSDSDSTSGAPRRESFDEGFSVSSPKCKVFNSILYHYKK